jgi:homoaconitase/3-isopropylmalate dehydratase large subunit
MTLSEKILSRHAVQQVRSGEIIVANVNLVYMHDANRP